MVEDGADESDEDGMEEVVESALELDVDDITNE